MITTIDLITAIATAFTAIGGVIVALKLLLPALDLARRTHHLVNQGHTDSINYQNALIRALKARGIEVPIDQSAPIGGTQKDEHNTSS